MAILTPGLLLMAELLYDTEELRAIICNGTWNPSANPSEGEILRSAISPDREPLTIQKLEANSATGTVDIEVVSTDYVPSVSGIANRWAIIRANAGGSLIASGTVNVINSLAPNIVIVDASAPALQIGDRLYFKNSTASIVITVVTSATEYKYEETADSTGTLPAMPAVAEPIRGMLIAGFAPSQAGQLIAGTGINLYASGGNFTP